MSDDSNTNAGDMDILTRWNLHYAVGNGDTMHVDDTQYAMQ